MSFAIVELLCGVIVSVGKRTRLRRNGNDASINNHILELKAQDIPTRHSTIHIQFVRIGIAGLTSGYMYVERTTYRECFLAGVQQICLAYNETMLSDSLMENWLHISQT